MASTGQHKRRSLAPLVLLLCLVGVHECTSLFGKCFKGQSSENKALKEEDLIGLNAALEAAKRLFRSSDMMSKEEALKDLELIKPFYRTKMMDRFALHEDFYQLTDFSEPIEAYCEDLGAIRRLHRATMRAKGSHMGVRGFLTEALGSQVMLCEQVTRRAVNEFKTVQEQQWELVDNFTRDAYRYPFLEDRPPVKEGLYMLIELDRNNHNPREVDRAMVERVAGSLQEACKSFSTSLGKKLDVLSTMSMLGGCYEMDTTQMRHWLRRQHLCDAARATDLKEEIEDLCKTYYKC